MARSNLAKLMEGADELRNRLIGFQECMEMKTRRLSELEDRICKLKQEICCLKERICLASSEMESCKGKIEASRRGRA